MPQKKNPDVAELSRGKSARLAGDLMALLTLCKGLPLTYNRDLQEDKEQIFDAVDTAELILKVYPSMIETMAIRRERMREAAADPALMATDLAEKLVELGVPFRDAHHRVGAFVKYCRERGVALDCVPVSEMRLTMPEATDEFPSLFSPENSVAKRDITGGTGYRQVASQIEFWQRELGAAKKTEF
jgi:argininosuccinate lyase